MKTNHSATRNGGAPAQARKGSEGRGVQRKCTSYISARPGKETTESFSVLSVP